MKSDQEPAILTLVEMIKASWNGNMALEQSPVGESEANVQPFAAAAHAEHHVRELARRQRGAKRRRVLQRALAQAGAAAALVGKGGVNFAKRPKGGVKNL